MWRTADGALHTVALPEPAEAFTSSSLVAVVAVLDGLTSEVREEVLEEMEMRCVALWETSPGTVEEAEEEHFHAVAVPRGVFTAEPVDRTALQEAVAQVHPRWRLDVVLAMQDVVADADDMGGGDDAAVG